jgi:hypothetical protein
MNCEHCQELLHQGRGADAAPELRLHLQSCADCAAVSASLRTIGGLLDAELTPSSGLRRQVLARLEQEVPTRSFATLFALLWSSRPVGAFSYSLALVLVGMFSGHLLPTDTSAAETEYQLCPLPDRPPNNPL